MSKPLPILSQMPWNVNQLIVSSADTVTKQALRVCSKIFKNLVQNSEISYEKLMLAISTDRKTATVTLHSLESERREDGPKLEYTSTPNGYTVKNEKTNEEKAVGNRNFIPAAIEQFLKIFRNPKTFVNCFYLSFGMFYKEVELFEDTKREVLEEMCTFFMSLNRQVAVQEFIFRFDGAQEDVLKLLPFIKPGILQKIGFTSIHPTRRRPLEIDLSQIAETEQWKQAKELFLFKFKTSVPCEKWSNFAEYNFFRSEFTLAENIALTENFFHNPSFKKCHMMFTTFDSKSYLEHFLRFDPEITGRIGKDITLKIDTPSQRDMWFIVEIKSCSLDISKVRREQFIEPIGENERIVKLTAAQVLADINKYKDFLSSFVAFFG